MVFFYKSIPCPHPTSQLSLGDQFMLLEVDLLHSFLLLHNVFVIHSYHTLPFHSLGHGHPGCRQYFATTIHKVNGILCFCVSCSRHPQSGSAGTQALCICVSMSPTQVLSKIPVPIFAFISFPVLHILASTWYYQTFQFW